MTPGDRMVRLEDGKSGVVQEMDGELRIVYSDRRETYVAGKREKWVPAAAPARALREEEIQEVARVADHWLECLEKNLPRYTAGALSLPARPVHDMGLHAVIVLYLRKRP